jgi:hypothetical protein
MVQVPAVLLALDEEKLVSQGNRAMDTSFEQFIRHASEAERPGSFIQGKGLKHVFP